jgi:lycopene beta-cyclase
MEHYQYLMVLAACVAATLPLEVITGARVYRRPRSALRAVGWTAMPFVAWDAAAARAHMWTYNPLYIVGWRPVLGLPVEELLFFVVVPLCALLTFEAVEASLSRADQRG